MRPNAQKKAAKIFGLAVFVLLFYFLPRPALAATLSISPSSGNYQTGDRVTVKVIATSNNTPFNAVSGVVVVPTSVFSIESVFKTNSVLDFWVTEPKINGNTVKFEGVALGGFGGSSGTVVTLNLRAIKAGAGAITFQSGQILANDGEGTDITGALTGGNYVITQATAPAPNPAPTPTPTPTPVEEPQPKPTLKAPEIMYGTRYGAPAILGTSDYPSAQTLVTFTSPAGAKVYIVGVAEPDGSFNILVPTSLKRGDYTVTAVMVRPDKSNSDQSNTIIVKVGGIFSDITPEFWILLLLLILAIIYLLVRIYYHLKRDKTRGTRVDKHKLAETEDIIHKSFDLLQEDIVDHKTLTEIKKDITDAEKIIDKKIKDVDS
ncbi:MAG: cohesin domain-containing protein [Patescibacteria group bacterium]